MFYINGLSWVVIWSTVSKIPPWSMATSMMTEPGDMDFTISSVTSFGAFAPGINTAPMTRSASFIVSLIL